MEKSVRQVLAEGGVAVLATDTIYGLVGQALNQSTVERIYDIKKRHPDKPFIILISDITDLESFGVALNDYQRGFLAEYWPGPVSFILSCQSKDINFLTQSTGSLAFRLPDNPSLLQLVKEVGPLIAPSANPEGEPPAQNILEAKKYFGNKVDIYLDGGELHSVPSTLIRLGSNGFEVLRQGETAVI